MKILAIYDNGGRTLDRYTVVVDDKQANGLYECLGMNTDGRGYSQWGTCTLGRHLGKKVTLESLHSDTIKHIQERVIDETS